MTNLSDARAFFDLVQGRSVYRMPSVLLIDGNAEERRGLGEYLSYNGFDVTHARYVDVVPGPKAAEDFDAIVIVASLPDPSVSNFIRRLAANEGPALLVMSETGEYVERVLALELGADDMVAREINPRELLARLRGLLRRRVLPRGEVQRPIGGAGEVWMLRAVTRSLVSSLGHSVDLSKADFALVSAFIDGEDQVIQESQTSCAPGAWGGVALRTAVSRLRRRALAQAQVVLPIRTVRGSGYRFDAPISRG